MATFPENARFRSQGARPEPIREGKKHESAPPGRKQPWIAVGSPLRVPVVHQFHIPLRMEDVNTRSDLKRSQQISKRHQMAGMREVRHSTASRKAR